MTGVLVDIRTNVGRRGCLVNAARETTFVATFWGHSQLTAGVLCLLVIGIYFPNNARLQWLERRCFERRFV